MAHKILACSAILVSLALPVAFAAEASDGWFGFSLWVDVAGSDAGPRIASASVSGVVPGSPADRQHVEVGESLVAVEGAPVAGMAPGDLKARMAKPVGARLTLTLQRSGGAARTAVLVAAARPAAAPR